MDVAIDRLKDNAKYGMINMHGWMFIKSFLHLRENIISNYQIDSLIHLGTRTFIELGGEVHFVCGDHVAQTFTNFVVDKHFTHLVIGEAPSHLVRKSPSVYDKLTASLNNLEIITLQYES